MAKTESLHDKIIAALPELAESTEFFWGRIQLTDDVDGTGEYISKWDYSTPIPESLASYDRT